MIDSIHCAPSGIFNEAVIDVRSRAASCCYIRDRWFTRLSTITEFNWPDVVWLLCWAELRYVQLTITAIRYSWTMNADCMYTVHEQSPATSTLLLRWISVYSRYTLAGTTILTENTHDDVGKLYVFASVAQRIEHRCDAELRRRCEHWRRTRWNDGMAVTVAFFIDAGCSGNCRMYVKIYYHALSMSQDFVMCDPQLYIIMVGEYEWGLSKVIDDLCN